MNEIDLSDSSNFPLKVSVNIPSKRHFIDFCNLCVSMGIQIIDKEVIEKTVIQNVEIVKNELTINDILAELNVEK